MKKKKEKDAKKKEKQAKKKKAAEEAGKNKKAKGDNARKKRTRVTGKRSGAAAEGAVEGGDVAAEGEAPAALADEVASDEIAMPEEEPDISLPVSLHRRSKPLQVYLQQAKGGHGPRYMIGVADNQSSKYKEIVESLKEMCNNGEITKRSLLVRTKTI